MSAANLAPETRYVRASDVVATDMNGETVMMDVHKGSYFALTGSGSQIWEQLEEPKRVDELIAALDAEFDASSVEDFEGLITGFVSDLLAKGLVKPAD